jgi:hypothetical protein
MAGTTTGPGFGVLGNAGAVAIEVSSFDPDGFRSRIRDYTGGLLHQY